MLAEGLGAIAPLLQLLQDELGPGGHHKILLVHPEQPSRLVAVVGVEEGGQAGGQVGLVEVDALLRGGGGVLHVEQVEAVGHAGVRAGDGDVEQPGFHRAEAEGHLKLHPGGDEPAFVLDPGVGPLVLAAVAELLLEQAVVVVEAHPVPRQAQGGDGVQEAGRQTAQPAVAQGGLGLHVLQAGQGLPALIQRGLYVPVYPQGQQVVAQQLADEEFGGEIVQLPLPLGGGAGGGQLLGELEQGVVELAVPTLGQLQAVPGLGDLLKAVFHIHEQRLLSKQSAGRGPSGPVPRRRGHDSAESIPPFPRPVNGQNHQIQAARPSFPRGWQGPPSPAAREPAGGAVGTPPPTVWPVWPWAGAGGGRGPWTAAGGPPGRGPPVRAASATASCRPGWRGC